MSGAFFAKENVSEETRAFISDPVPFRDGWGGNWEQRKTATTMTTPAGVEAIPWCS